MVCGAAATLLLWPFDGAVMGMVTAGGTRTSLPIGGDLMRELEAVQQFGQGGISLIVAAAVWLMDRPRRRALLGWLAAAVIAAGLAKGLKLLIGRPRPVLDEPGLLLGPFGVYPLGEGRGLAHAWEFWRDGVERLWSMPSSHTVYAVVAAGMLSRWYPRLAPLAWGLAGVVAACRVAIGAHYPADVAAGWFVGLLALALARRTGLCESTPGRGE